MSSSEQAGISVYLEKKDLGYLSSPQDYVLTVTNSNDFNIHINGSEVFWNDIYCDNYFAGMTVPAGETVTSDTGTNLGIFAQLGLWTSPGQLRFDLSIQKSISGAFIMRQQTFRVELSRETMLVRDTEAESYRKFDQPQFEAQALEQVLLETPEYTVTLLGLGGAGEDRLTDMLQGVLCVENRSKEPLVMELQGASVNGVYLDAYVQGYFDTVPPGSKCYQFFELDDYGMEPWQLTSVADISLLLQRTDYSPLFSGNSLSQLFWCPLVLSESGTAGTFPEGERVLFEENGIRVCLIRSERNYESGCRWYLTVVNDTDQDIALGLTDIRIDGQAVENRNAPIYLYNASLGAHQKTVCELSCNAYEDRPMPENIQFRFWIMDFRKESILYTAQQEVLLLTPPYENE